MTQGRSRPKSHTSAGEGGAGYILDSVKSTSVAMSELDAVKSALLHEFDLRAAASKIDAAAAAAAGGNLAGLVTPKRSAPNGAVMRR